MEQAGVAHYHLPGLFEFYELYRVFLPLFREHREYFYDWCDIGSIYGAPADCVWGGGRVGGGACDPRDVRALMREYGVSARLTFSNSLLRAEHLSDARCNALCALFSSDGQTRNGVIVHSDVLLDYLQKTYPKLYFVSSTTKVLTEFEDLRRELARDAFSYVVPDFRLNKAFDRLSGLSAAEKDKVRRSAAKTSGWTGRSTAAPRRGRTAAIAFPERWPIRGLSAWATFKTSICRWAFPISKSKGAGWEVR